MILSRSKQFFRDGTGREQNSVLCNARVDHAEITINEDP